MNKFYFEKRVIKYRASSTYYWTIYCHASAETVDLPFDYHYVEQENMDLFDDMCAVPAKSILWLNHEDKNIQEIAKLILSCKEPVKIKMWDE